MASLTKRSLVLTFSRVTNQAILLFSPIFLVRLLSTESYGQYREFVLYAAISSTVIGFAVNRSLPYLIPKYPQKQSVFTTQTIMFTLMFYVVGALIILAAQNLIIGATSFNFVSILVIYLFFFVNLDFIELFWIAKKRTDLVLYYSAGRASIRLIAVIAAAYFSNNVFHLAYALIAAELLRFLFISILIIRQPKTFLCFSGIDLDTLRVQLVFFVPLGLVGILVAVNKNLGQLIVASQIGASALAFYFIGTYSSYFTRLVRSSVADVIFPEMVEKKDEDISDRLVLWRRATTIYWFLMVPVSVLAFAYADTIIVLAFSETYLPAVPVFKVFAIAILMNCFDFHLPLRLMNRNIFILAGVSIYLVVNLVTTLVLLPAYGILAPAIAYALSNLVLNIFSGYQVSRLTEIRVSNLLHWDEVWKISLSALIALPLVLFSLLPSNFEFISRCVGGVSFLVSYFWLVNRHGVPDLIRLTNKIRAVPGKLAGRRR